MQYNMSLYNTQEAGSCKHYRRQYNTTKHYNKTFFTEIKLLDVGLELQTSGARLPDPGCPTAIRLHTNDIART